MKIRVFCKIHVVPSCGIESKEKQSKKHGKIFHAVFIPTFLWHSNRQILKHFIRFCAYVCMCMCVFERGPRGWRGRVAVIWGQMRLMLKIDS